MPLRQVAAIPGVLWSDEFAQAAGTKPDATKWTYDLGGNGWGNAELETYTSDAANASVVEDSAATDGKALAITALRSGSSYTSARIKTQGLFSAKYGRVEARIRVPAGKGIWPAFWMLGTNIGSVGWPACGEIDVMEILGHEPSRLYGTAHGPGYSGGNGIGNNTLLASGGRADDGYHLYSVVWQPDKIQWLLDGRLYHSVTTASLPGGTNWVFNSDFFLILNLAVGGNWPGSPDANTSFPATLLVDYVRVYDLTPTAPTRIAGYVTASGAVDLSWMPSDCAFGSSTVSYLVQRANDSAFTQGLTLLDPGIFTGLRDASVVAERSYWYRVLARSTQRDSAYSESAVVVVPTKSSGGGNLVKLSNLSARCMVGTGENIGVAGFWVGGDKPIKVLIRAIGPALAPYGIAGYLRDPLLCLYEMNGNALIATNAGWSGGGHVDEIEQATRDVGAGLVLARGTADSALYVTLSPGGYSAQVSGSTGSTGVAVIEVYQVD